MQFITTNLNHNEGDMLVTMLDYELLLSETLKQITITNDKIKTVIVDAAIYTGLNQCRFIKFGVVDNKIDLQHPLYITPSDELLKLSNQILKELPTYVNNSVMTHEQKQLLLNS